MIDWLKGYLEVFKEVAIFVLMTIIGSPRVALLIAWPTILLLNYSIYIIPLIILLFIVVISLVLYLKELRMNR